MLSIRKVTTSSGSTAIQVVVYIGHKAKVIKHIGSARKKEDIDLLLRSAQQYVSSQTKQNILFPPQRSPILVVDRSKCIGVTHHFAHQFFQSCANECGLSIINSLLLNFALIRLIEPASKLRSLWLLKKYFDVSYSGRIYRNIPKLLQEKNKIEHIAFRCATKALGEKCYIVLYDVTTLYFETHSRDELRVPGFSKDDKSKQPQIVIGLLVSISGFPLAHEVFSGNSFEGKTMLPVLEHFVKEHSVSTPVVVADAAMLSEKNIEQLQQAGISYIVGGRMANTSVDFIKRVSSELSQKNGAIARRLSKHGDMICSFSSARYRKQHREMKQQLENAQKILSGSKAEKRTKFLKSLHKKFALNEELIQKTKLLLGVKGYCTNIPQKTLSNEKVIERYHDLWHIEQSFRMSKSDLQTRPIFHHKENAIRAHVLICFVSLMLEKYLELSTGLTLRTIRDMILNVTETHIQDTLTKEIFVFRSSAKEILDSPLGKLIIKWQIPH